MKRCASVALHATALTQVWRRRHPSGPTALSAQPVTGHPPNSGQPHCLRYVGCRVIDWLPGGCERQSTATYGAVEQSYPIWSYRADEASADHGLQLTVGAGVCLGQLGAYL